MSVYWLNAESELEFSSVHGGLLPTSVNSSFPERCDFGRNTEGRPDGLTAVFSLYSCHRPALQQPNTPT